MKELTDRYYKAEHDGPSYISGLNMPDPKKGPYHFIRCDFHPALREVLAEQYKDSKFSLCTKP